tara:strand:+ start:460 stop:924 length:465 start_codon:yes stop_codon:yes gene_type:complete
MSGIIGGAGSKSGVIGTTELDYEEGTCTLTSTDAHGSGSGGNLSTTMTANYTKIGRAVTVVLEKYNINKTGMTSGNDFYLIGLPFVNGTYAAAGGMASAALGTGGTYGYTVVCEGGASWFRFAENLNASYWDFVTVGNITDGWLDLVITITYFV